MLFEMFWCHIYRGFYEVVCYRAIHTFLLGMTTPMIAEELCSSRCDENKSSISHVFKEVIIGLFKFSLINLAVFCLFRVFDGANVINTILTDITISAIFLNGLLNIFISSHKSNGFSLLSLILCSSSIVLTKQIGITFVMLLWLYYGISVFIPHFKSEKRSSIIKYCSLIAMPLLFLLSWKLYIKDFNVSAQFAASKISLSVISSTLKDSYITTFERQTLNNFIYALFEKNITTASISISFISITFASIVLIWLIHLYRTDYISLYDSCGITSVLFIGAVGYTITIAVLFLFCFSEIEVSTLANFERYMGGYALPEILFVLFIICLRVNKSHNKNDSCKCILLICSMIVLSGPGMKALIPGIIDGDHFENYKNAAAKLDRVIPPESTVFILSDSTIQAQYYINFYCDKTNIVLCYENLMSKDSIDDYESAVVNNAFGYDYLYIDSIDRKFNERFRSINNNEDFQETKIYKIVPDDNNGIRSMFIE